LFTTQIERVVTASGNSGHHVVVLKAWIGKEGYCRIKGKKKRKREAVVEDESLF
jgi:putative transposon-encoded protein